MNRFISRIENARNRLPEPSPKVTLEYLSGKVEKINAHDGLMSAIRAVAEKGEDYPVRAISDDPPSSFINAILAHIDDDLVASIPEVMDPPPDAPEDDEPPAYLVDSSDDEDEDELHEVIAPLPTPLSTDSRVQEIHEKKPKRTSIHG